MPDREHGDRAERARPEALDRAADDEQRHRRRDPACHESHHEQDDARDVRRRRPLTVGGVAGHDRPDQAGEHERAERPPVEVEAAEVVGDPRRHGRDRERLERDDRHVDRQPHAQAVPTVAHGFNRLLSRCGVTVAPGTLVCTVTVLDEILTTKRAEVQGLRARASELEAAAGAAPPVRDFAGALRRVEGRLAVVAEIKRRSPSKGDLAPDLVPADTARATRRAARPASRC